jgi:cystathionine beta-lyase
MAYIIEAKDRRGTHSVKWDLAQSPDVLALWVADMDFPCPPEVVEAVKSRADHGIFGYTFTPESYFEVFRQWAWDTQEWKIKREHQLYALGMMPAIRELILSLTNPGDGVIVQPPVYNPFYTVIEHQGRRVLENPLIFDPTQAAPYAMNFDQLEQIASRPEAKVLLLCSPHNPVGRIWKTHELSRVVEICTRNNVVVVADEIHGDLTHPGNQFIPLGTFESDWIISIQSPGKSFNIPSINSAQVVISNSELRKKVQQGFDLAGFEIVNSLSLAAAEAAYTYGKPWLHEIRQKITANIELFDALLAHSNLPLKRIPSEATYLAWVSSGSMEKSLRMNTKELQRRLLKDVGVWVIAGSQYGADSGEGFLRFNLGTSQEILREAVTRIRHWWEENER